MQVRFRGQRLMWLACGLVLAPLGCGGKPLSFAEVEGKVMMRGRVLRGVEVKFYPVSDDPKQLPYAVGKTDSSGVYRLTLLNGKPGALVGPNKVVVHWPLPERNPDRPPPPPPGPPIPIKYTAADESPITVDVKPGGRQTVDLNLT